MNYIIILVVVIVLFALYKSGKFDKKETPVVAPTAFFPCVIDGNFDMPSHEVRIASRNTSLLNHGHVVTGDDGIDNSVLGGGTPDGGIFLCGSFHFEIDAVGQKTDASWIKVFSDVQNPVTGGVTGAGEIWMGSPAGLTITGKIVGSGIEGKVSETGMIAPINSDMQPNLEGNRVSRDGKECLEYVHGVMSGTHRLV